MATIPVSNPIPCVITLATGLTGNTTSNIADRGRLCQDAAMFSIAYTGSASCTMNIQGSADGANWFNAPYALLATPSTFVASAITLTPAATSYYIMMPAIPWEFLQFVLSGNTTVTITTATLTIF